MTETQVNEAPGTLKERWPEFAVYGLLGLSAIYGLLLIFTGLGRVVWPGFLTFIEPQPYIGTLRLLAGEPLYQDYTVGRPVVPLTYGALTYLVPSWLAGSASISDVVVSGRLVSYLSMFGCLGLLMALARKRGATWLGAAAACFPLFWFPFIFGWFSKFTPDAAAVFFSLAGWFAASQSRRNLPALWIALAVALWTIGFHFKPSTIVGPVAFGFEELALIWKGKKGEGDKRSWVWLAAAAAGSLIAVFATAAMANVMTDGMWRFNLVDSMAVGEFSPAFAAQNIYNFKPALLLSEEAPVIFGNITTFALMVIWAVMRARKHPLFAAFVFLFVVQTFAMFKQGSGINYYLGEIALWGVAAVLAGPLKLTKTPPVRDAVFAIIVTLIMLLDIPRTQLTFFIMIPVGTQTISAMDSATADAAPEEILILDSVYAVHANMPLLWADSYHASLLAENDVVDFTPEVEAISRREFRYIVTNLMHIGFMDYHRLEFFPPDIGEAIEDNYNRLGGQGWLVLWERNAPREPAAETGEGTRRESET